MLVAKRSESELAYSAGSLKGDLDNVVLKALRHEPNQRYQSVEQISDDIWRFIDGLPVLACPATLSYRVSKFVTRNKVPVIAAVFVVVSLLVGIIVAVSQTRSARQQARVAREQIAVAQREKERAEKTSRFMQSFIDYANPEWYARGKNRTDVTVREAVDDAATRIDEELADQIEVRADLHYTIGLVYQRTATLRQACDINRSPTIYIGRLWVRTIRK